MSRRRVVPHITAAMLLAWGLSASAAAPHGGHGSSHTPDRAFDEAAALKVSQSAIGRTLDATYRFTSSEGRVVTLGELRGKPLVVSLVYTSCYHVCPTITQTVANTVKIAREALGEASFNVITIGFDSAVDTPARMHTYRRERGVHGDNWQFLSADAATVELLVKDIGFIYFRSPKGFDHLAQTTIVDANGKVYRQVYGDSFATPTLVEPLKDLVFGRKASTKNWDGWINGVKLFCTVYDPTTGRYKFDYSLFVAILSGLASFVVLGVFIVRTWRQGGGPQRPA